MYITPAQPPEDHDFEILKRGLTHFNEQHTGLVFRERVASFVKDDSGLAVGGALAEINWDWMHIQGLWVDDSIRLGGWGSKLINALEQHALSHNIVNVRLETTTFQALDFYLKLGYVVFGELPDMPKGHTSYFLQKQLRK